jgi:mRNA interferase RelE/StbE
LDPPLAKRLITEIGRLREGPFPFGFKKLEGVSQAYRLRTGDYRVLYEVDKKARTIRVFNMEHRSRACR